MMMLVNLIGLGLIGLIVWWFWLYKPKSAVDITAEKIEIVVNDGIYHPARIKVMAGVAVELVFVRKDGSPCASTVIFPDVEVSEELPLNEHKLVKLPAMPAGEYEFHCPMKMYKGTLIVAS
jgi:plastocyanin domain-containing protein